MLRRVVLLVIDGLGDRPIEALGRRTPLEAAVTPNFDQLAVESQCGTMCALGRGSRPGSDTSHLAILGYPPSEFYAGRGPIEVAGLGVQLLDGDVALRANLGTVGEDGMIQDRRAGRILDIEPLTDTLDGMVIDGVQFIVRAGTAHRAGIVLRGENLSDRISDGDPHEPDQPTRPIVALDRTAAASHTADVLNLFLAKSHELLREHALNKQREAQGLLPANFLLLRGAGLYRSAPCFEERYGLSACCIAGGGLYKGIGSLLGMTVPTVPGASGLSTSDIAAKFRAVHEQLASHDFVLVHVKAADSHAEDGDFIGKRDFIQRVDAAAKELLHLPKDVLLVITADHSTPCELKQHSADPVPLVFHGEGVRVDGVTTFGERSCAEGGLGFYSGLDVMPQVMNCLGRLKLIGA